MSHVKSYTKQDGTFVAEHSNSVNKKPVILFQSKQKKPPEGYHPQKNDKGKTVSIDKLSHSTDGLSWDSPDEIATVTPHDHRSLPDALFGVKFTPWLDAPESLQDWDNVDGQREIDEPEFQPVKGKKVGSGVIVQEDDGRVWIVHPTNGFGGYDATFPKGTLEDGLEMQASAIKEAYEESGLKVEIMGFLGDVERSTSKARYYLARRVGGSPSAMGWESQAVSLCPAEKLKDVLNQDVDHGLVDLLKDI